MGMVIIVLIGSLTGWFASSGLSVNAEICRGAYLSVDLQRHPVFVSTELGTHQRTDFDTTLSATRNAAIAEQPLRIGPGAIYFTL